MNFSQLHERLRMELVRRIDSGLLTAASLARQSGLQQPHISNFLRSKRRLSLPALDRVLAALSLSVEDLLVSAESTAAYTVGPPDSVPLVSQTSAMFDAAIAPSASTQRFPLPPGSLEDLRARQLFRRRDWQRFVAVGVTPAQARPMEPVIAPNAIVVLDRHYSALTDYQPPRPNIYAIQLENTMLFRYVSFDSGRLILRPYSLEYPVQLVEIEPRLSPSDLIVGRVCIIFARA
jgi:transcriptional regulator with XRE-family HTH domain